MRQQLLATSLQRRLTIALLFALGCSGESPNAASGVAGSTGVGGSSAGGGNGSAGASNAAGDAPNPSAGQTSNGGGGSSALGGSSTVGGSPTVGSSGNGGMMGVAGAGGSTAGASGGGAGGATAAGASGAAGSLGSSDPTKKITVWLAGDSTMQPCNGSCPCGWGSQFQPYLSSNATVVDSAAGGRSIQTWLYDPNVSGTMMNGECVVSPKTYSARWQAMLDPSKGMKPGDYLFIEFGINDTDSTCNRHVGTALFQTYLSAMAQAAKERGAQPVFLTSTSYMQCTGSEVKPNRSFGPETKAAGAASGVPVIDLSALSAALYTTLGLCPNSGDFTSSSSAVGKFFCDDHTHFEAAGATKIAGVVAQALRDQKLGLAAYLK